MALMSLLSACSKKDDKKQAQATVPEVDVAEVQTDSVTLHATFPGFIYAENKIDVVARVSGTLQSVNYSSGQYVSKGQVLFTIESTTYADAVQRAQASLQDARSQAQYCQRRLAAMEKAYASNAVSEMDVISARNSLVQAQAAISTGEAELRDAQTNLGYCTVRAPGSGYITKPNIDPGNYVGGGASPVTLATIYDSDKVTASFSITDARYEQMICGSGGPDAPIYRSIPLTFAEQVPHTYTADLYYTAPNIDQSTGTMLLKGKIDNKYNELKDGMFVSVDIPFGTNMNAMVVKDASISTDQRGKYMYVVNANDEVEYRSVEVGQVWQDTLRIIDSGLKPGERYVTKALLSVRPGMKIKPILTK